MLDGVALTVADTVPLGVAEILELTVRLGVALMVFEGVALIDCVDETVLLGVALTV